MMTQVCNRCLEKKTLDQFSKGSSKNGTQYKCKVCAAQYRLNNLEAIKARDAAYYLANKDLIDEKAKQWARDNPGRNAINTRRYAKRNFEAVKQMKINWKKANPDKLVEYEHRRRTLVSGSAEHYIAKEFQELCDIYGNVCLCCGAGGRLTVDHVIAISQGGSNSINNIQPLCGFCNSSKGAKNIDYRQTLLRQNS